MKHSTHISFNGELFPLNTFKTELNNRAFRYGDGLFETMRTRGVSIPFFDDHWNRLERGMKVFKMNPGLLNHDMLRNAIERLIHSDRLYNGNSVRVQVVRKAGGKYEPQTNDIDVYIEVNPVENNLYVLNNKGLFIDTYEEQLKASGTIGNFKNCSSILYTLAGIYKQERQLDDVLIINEKGSLTEALSSNIFFYADNKLITPSLKTGCVDGIMRKIIIEIAQEASIEVLEPDYIEPESLLNADEVFISNAMRGINWVVAFRNKRYVYKLSRKIIAEINKKAGF